MHGNAADMNNYADEFVSNVGAAAATSDVITGGSGFGKNHVQVCQ